MKIITTIILFLTTLNITAQPSIAWQKSLGGSLQEKATSIKQTTDGGYILTAQTESNNGDVTGNQGSHDCWVVKLTNIGVISWQKSLGGSSVEEGVSIQQTDDGGYIVAGSSYSNDGDVSGNQGGYDYWIVKLTNSGMISWQKSLGGSKNEFVKSILQTSDGGYIVAGSSYSDDGDIVGHHGNTNNPDYWVVKLTNTGIISWQKSLGGSFIDEASSIQQTIDGGYIVAGRSHSNDGDVSGNHGGSDFWVVKLTSSGVISWQKSLGGSSSENASSIQQTNDGGYIVAGSCGSNNSNGNDGDVLGNHGDSDYWVVKLTSFGSISWQKSLGGLASEYAFSIQQTSDSGYIVAGFSISNDGDVSGNQGSRDYWVIKLNNSGVVSWQKSLGGSADEEAYSIQQTTDGGYIIAGYSTSNNGDVTGNYGSRDCWIVKLSPTVGINEILSSPILNIFPNPTKNQISLEADTKLLNSEYSIYNYVGQSILSGKLTNESTLIKVGNLSSGIYFIKIHTSKGIISSCFVKE